MLVNGVKYGTVLCQILFTVYMAVLLNRLKESGIGCHIVNIYADAFGLCHRGSISTKSKWS